LHSATFFEKIFTVRAPIKTQLFTFKYELPKFGVFLSLQIIFQATLLVVTQLISFLLLFPLNITILQKKLQKSSKELEKMQFYPFFEEKSHFGQKNGKSS
jgi:hypothetical protein